MLHRFLLLVVALLSGAASLSADEPLVAGKNNGEPKLAGQPSWFPLGEDIYHSTELEEAERQLLSIRLESRWFLGFPKAATKAEFEAWRKAQVGKSEFQEPAERAFQIPSSPQYPKRAIDLAAKEQGATLKLAITLAKEPEELTIELTLAATEREIRREVEHRHTNVLPFLFAFYADGQAVSHKLDGYRKDGGANRLVELVPAKSERNWRLRVDGKSLAQLVPAKTKELTIIAAFSERKHEGYLESGVGPLESWDLSDLKPQILIRSDPVRLVKTNEGWKSP